jgi:propionyl-CoA carboxylase alpha chain
MTDQQTDQQPEQQAQPRAIARVLVANRTEIASRVFATCRRLGLETVAVHSDPDAGLPFVADADAAVHLPGSTPAETYLRGDLVIAAAQAAGADAIHPGYGFLSENAEFARTVLAAGLTWIGPSPESMDAMSTKREAKALVAEAGVPVLGELDPAQASDADLPLLVKASSGGGGRGMRVVRDLAALPSEVERAAAEAASAFGDATVFVEPYVEHGRHIEVQVVGDQAGTIVVFGERDCSLQRRHQKVLEESPAPGLTEEQRHALHEAARAAAAAVSYVGAGTVEFLIDAADPSRFWFLEMNTRLQVEHPVTECVYGVDLVEAQLRVAQGEPIGPDPQPRGGHAIEVRLYAEEPAADWRPVSGRLALVDIPADVSFAVPAAAGIRLDAGYGSGDEVGTNYDAMIAKVIAWAPTRGEAARRLAATLRRSRLHGIPTNRDALVQVLGDADFLAGKVDTSVLPAMTFSEPEGRFAAAVAGTLVRAVAAQAAAPVQSRIPAGWRNVASQWQVSTIGDEVVHWRSNRTGFEVENGAVAPDDAAEDGTTAAPAAGGSPEVRVVSVTPAAAVLEVGGVRRTFDVSLDGDRVDVDSSLGHHHLVVTPALPEPDSAAPAGSSVAAMPGTIVAVLVAAGDQVTAGQPLVVLEAMKMQHTVEASADGVVAELPAAVGTQVGAGDVLVVVESSAESNNSNKTDSSSTEERA